METLAALHGTFATLWVLWFFILFAGIILYVMAPWRKHGWERAAEIPLRDEPPAATPRAPSARRER